MKVYQVRKKKKKSVISHTIGGQEKKLGDTLHYLLDARKIVNLGTTCWYLGWAGISQPVISTRQAIHS
jgi:hypothetical protein